MLDVKYIRENQDKIRWAITIKNLPVDLDQFLQLDKERVVLMQEIGELRRKKNENAKLMESVKGRKNKELIEEGRGLKERLREKEKRLSEIEETFQHLMVQMPTVPAPDTPIGKDSTENVEVLKWGSPPVFDFQPKDHIELGKVLDVLDLERGAKVAGYRGYYVKNDGVMLQMGIMMHALQKAIQRGFQPTIPPTLVREFALFGSGYFKGRTYNPHTDEIYKIANDDTEADGSVKKDPKFLVGTAEPSLLAYYADEILEERDLPIKICGFSPCYRSEIGSYGKDTKGLYRVHEFMKVELVCLTRADIEESDSLHEEMIAFSRELHEGLGLPYRQIRICSGDLTIGKYKQYDLEAWIPSRNEYGETGSASNFLDWQSRRLNVRYRDKNGDVKFVYMLNDTALPSPRILISILENYQQKDGSIKVPEVLVKYVGKEKIIPKS